MVNALKSRGKGRGREAIIQSGHASEHAERRFRLEVLRWEESRSFSSQLAVLANNDEAAKTSVSLTDYSHFKFETPPSWSFVARAQRRREDLRFFSCSRFFHHNV